MVAELLFVRGLAMPSLFAPTAKTAALGTGAHMLQSKGPVEKISYYLDGFHAAKADSKMQREAHHYCNQVTEGSCALKGKMDSYGKTWHTWMSGMYAGKNDSLPLGAPQLQWRFNRDGEDLPGMVDARDRRMNLNTAEARKDREDLAALAKAQGGVDAMAGMFPNAKLMNGVRDNGDAGTKPVPTFGLASP